MSDVQDFVIRGASKRLSDKKERGDKKRKRNTDEKSKQKETSLVMDCQGQ